MLSVMMKAKPSFSSGLEEGVGNGFGLPCVAIAINQNTAYPGKLTNADNCSVKGDKFEAFIKDFAVYRV